MNNKQRAKEFLECLGNGKSIYQIERENDLIDKQEEANKLLQECGKSTTDYLQGFQDGKWQTLKEFKDLIKLNCHCKNKEFLLLKLNTLNKEQKEKR